MDVDRIQFKAEAATSDDPDEACEGCIFANQRMTVCHRAAELAKLRGLPDCEDKNANGQTHIYVRTKIDPRQMDLIGGGAEA